MTQSTTLYRLASLLKQLLSWKNEVSESPLFVGVNGPQGCGKSTLTRGLVQLLLNSGHHAVSVSIDDFYLTRQEQVELAREHGSNPLLQQRGYFGTHDIQLGAYTLESLKRISELREVEVPIYDKSKHRGQGDRTHCSEWNRVHHPLDFVFLEGWMLGFRAVPEAALPTDSLGRPGMSAQGAEAYIQKFLPAYGIYVHRLIESPLCPGHNIKLTVLRNRTLII